MLESMDAEDEAHGDLASRPSSSLVLHASAHHGAPTSPQVHSASRNSHSSQRMSSRRPLTTPSPIAPSLRTENELEETSDLGGRCREYYTPARSIPNLPKMSGPDAEQTAGAALRECDKARVAWPSLRLFCNGRRSSVCSTAPCVNS